MQRLFAEPGAWYTPGLARILPAVLRLAAHDPARTLLTRFVTPWEATQANGRWVQYYRRWPTVLLGETPPAMLDVVEPLAALAPPAAIADKTTYSVFNDGPAAVHLARATADTLVFSGVETDVCVLASVIDAVDRGYRVVVAGDAVASASEDGHEAVMRHVYGRLDAQVEIATVADIIAAWPSVTGTPA